MHVWVALNNVNAIQSDDDPLKLKQTIFTRLEESLYLVSLDCQAPTQAFLY